MIHIYTVFFSLAILFGNSFVKFSLSGVRPTELIFILSLYSIYKNNFPKIVIKKELIVYTICGIVFVIFSFMSFNESYTEFYDKSYIVRQSYFVLLMGVIVWGYYSCLVSDESTLKIHFRVLLNSIIFARTLNILFGITLGSESFTGIFALSEVVFFTGILFLSEKTSYKIFSFIYLFFSQYLSEQGLDKAIFLMVCLFYLLLLVGIPKVSRLLIMLSSFCFILFIIYLYSLGDLLRDLDVNTWWRVHLWGASLDLSSEYNYMGIGFGTEYYPIDFLYLQYEVNPTLKVLTYIETDEIFKHGPHNSFVTILLRMGVIGLLAYISIYFKLFKSINNIIKIKELRLFATFILLSQIFFIGLNMGLESPRYFLGVCFTFTLVCVLISKPEKIENFI